MFMRALTQCALYLVLILFSLRLDQDWVREVHRFTSYRKRRQSYVLFRNVHNKILHSIDDLSEYISTEAIINGQFTSGNSHEIVSNKVGANKRARTEAKRWMDEIKKRDISKADVGKIKLTKESKPKPDAKQIQGVKTQPKQNEETEKKVSVPKVNAFSPPDEETKQIKPEPNVKPTKQAVSPPKPKEEVIPPTPEVKKEEATPPKPKQKVPETKKEVSTPEPKQEVVSSSLPKKVVAPKEKVAPKEGAIPSTELKAEVVSIPEPKKEEVSTPEPKKVSKEVVPISEPEKTEKELVSAEPKEEMVPIPEPQEEVISIPEPKKEEVPIPEPMNEDVRDPVEISVDPTLRDGSINQASINASTSSFLNLPPDHNSAIGDLADANAMLPRVDEAEENDTVANSKDSPPTRTPGGGAEDLEIPEDDFLQPQAPDFPPVDEPMDPEVRDIVEPPQEIPAPSHSSFR